MNKQELTKLFEIAGVDITRGNAKAMIEKAPTEVSEGWEASGQKRQKDEMDKESEQHRKGIEEKHPKALKAYDAWRALGHRGSSAAKKAVDKGMP